MSNTFLPLLIMLLAKAVARPSPTYNFFAVVLKAPTKFIQKLHQKKAETLCKQYWMCSLIILAGLVCQVRQSFTDRCAFFICSIVSNSLSRENVIRSRDRSAQNFKRSRDIREKPPLNVKSKGKQVYWHYF